MPPDKNPYPVYPPTAGHHAERHVPVLTLAQLNVRKLSGPTQHIRGEVRADIVCGVCRAMPNWLMEIATKIADAMALLSEMWN